MSKFVAEFYETENGYCPVRDFLDSVEPKMRAKLLRLIVLLEENGNELRDPYSKPIGDGLFELRAKQGTHLARILYFFIVGKHIILTNGFVKKTPKTPRSEIQLARKYMNHYSAQRRDSK